VHHGDLRNALRRQPRLVGEAAPALDEHLGLVHQVGAAALDQIDQRQLVLGGDLLRTQAFFKPSGATVPPLMALSLADTSTRLPATNPMPIDRAASEHGLLAVVIVQAQTGQRRELEEVRTAVDQARHALARQQLAALRELVALGVGLGISTASPPRTR
jgi:hypothetical protein